MWQISHSRQVRPQLLPIPSRLLNQVRPEVDCLDAPSPLLGSVQLLRLLTTLPLRADLQYCVPELSRRLRRAPFDFVVLKHTSQTWSGGDENDGERRVSDNVGRGRGCQVGEESVQVFDEVGERDSLILWREYRVVRAWVGQLDSR